MGYMDDWQQPALPGTKVKKGNDKGEEFEAHLDALHDFYRLQRLIDVDKNAEKWTFKYDRAARFEEKWNAGLDTVAKTASGRRLLKIMSLPDYTGTNGTFGIKFDAKATSGKRITLQMLKPHQIENLKQAARCGVTAGFLVWFYEQKRCFFAPISFVVSKQELYERKANGRAKKGTASITIAELEKNGVEIHRSKRNDTWDWFTVLAQPNLFGRKR